MISFMAWSQLAVEEMSLSLRSSRNACFASSLVAYCGLDRSLGGRGREEGGGGRVGGVYLNVTFKNGY